MDKTVQKPADNELELIVPTEHQKRAQRNRSGDWQLPWRCSCYLSTSVRLRNWA